MTLGDRIQWIRVKDQGFIDRLHQFFSIGVRDQQSVDEAILGAKGLSDIFGCIIRQTALSRSCLVLPHALNYGAGSELAAHEFMVW